MTAFTTQDVRRSATAPPAPGGEPTSGSHVRPPRLLRWSPVVAGALSTIYVGLGAWWRSGGRGWPWADPGDGFAISVVSTVSRPTAAALLTVAAASSLVLVVVSGVMRRSGGRRRAGRVVALAVAVLGLALAVVVPDFRLLAGVGYAPMALVWVLTGSGKASDVAAAYGWSWQNQVVLTLLGLALVGTAVATARAAVNACASCGRSDQTPAWRAPEAAARWGRWTVTLAVLVPVGYAVTRYAWFLGFGLGLSDETFAKVREVAPIGAGLATFGMVGAGLTLGLVQRWGEAVPRWVPVLGGRRVPVLAAVVPASLVSVLVTSAGVMFIRMLLSSAPDTNLPVRLVWADAAGWLPEMFWPLWGAALAASAYAYWLRRRRACSVCGRG